MGRSTFSPTASKRTCTDAGTKGTGSCTGSPPTSPKQGQTGRTDGGRANREGLLVHGEPLRVRALEWLDNPPARPRRHAVWTDPTISERITELDRSWEKNPCPACGFLAGQGHLNRWALTGSNRRPLPCKGRSGGYAGGSAATKAAGNPYTPCAFQFASSCTVVHRCAPFLTLSRPDRALTRALRHGLVRFATSRRPDAERCLSGFDRDAAMGLEPLCPRSGHARRQDQFIPEVYEVLGSNEVADVVLGALLKDLFVDASELLAI